MNEILQQIASRRTVKATAMNGKPIADDIVWQCLEAGAWAPTHGRTEPWQFHVYTQQALTSFCNDHAAIYQKATTEAEFNETKFTNLGRQGDAVSHAIVVIMKRTPVTKIPWVEEYAATAAAVQNILLAAESFGIAAIWSTGGMLLTDDMKAYYQLHADDAILGCLYLGYTDEEKKVGTRKHTVQEKTIWKG